MISKICQECGKTFLGADNPKASKICRSCVQKHANTKRKATMIDKYGVDNIMKLPNAADLIKAGFERKYGPGVHSAMDIPESKEKFKNTMIKKYGVPFYVQSKEYTDHSHFKISSKNIEVKNWLLQNGYDCELEFALDTKSFDIHIKNSNILIEIDPSYTHSTLPNHWSPNRISENYHVEKTKLAEINNYHCIHLFDWDNWKANLINILQNKYDQLNIDTTLEEIIIDRSKFLYKKLIQYGYKPTRFTRPRVHFSKDDNNISEEQWEMLSDDEKSKYLPVYDCGTVIMKRTNQDIKIIDELETNVVFPNYQQYECYVKLKKDKIRYKKCKFCGKEFIPNSSHQIYCKGPHIRQCPVCGKDYIEDNVDNLKRPPVACSYECRVKRTQETSLKRYNCKAPGNSTDARKKARNTMKKKYNVEYTLQSKELAEKTKQTILDKYGVDNVQKNKSIKQRSIKTSRQNKWKRKYGNIIPKDIQCDDMIVYVLKDDYAEKFIKEYSKSPFISAKLYAGLVKDGILYRCISFNPYQNHRLVIVQDCSLPYYNIIDGDIKIYQELTSSYDVSEIGKEI